MRMKRRGSSVVPASSALTHTDLRREEGWRGKCRMGIPGCGQRAADNSRNFPGIEQLTRATDMHSTCAGACWIRGTASPRTHPQLPLAVKVSTDVVAAERKLLDYHQAQGVFYPLIQVASTPPPSSAGSSPQPPSSPDGVANGANLQLQASIALAGGLVLLILSGRCAPPPHQPRASHNVPRRSEGIPPALTCKTGREAWARGGLRFTCNT